VMGVKRDCVLNVEKRGANIICANLNIINS